jgi:hypothetical protein
VARPCLAATPADDPTRKPENDPLTFLGASFGATNFLRRKRITRAHSDFSASSDWWFEVYGMTKLKTLSRRARPLGSLSPQGLRASAGAPLLEA